MVRAVGAVAKKSMVTFELRFVIAPPGAYLWDGTRVQTLTFGTDKRKVAVSLWKDC